ncbi:MAG: hypothetical protein IPN86_19345 [Saprospiraceae bacterium]|nr:hypothetical protein [Saprospiraceae bacterium]
MEILKTKQKGAVRNHPIFGNTAYGYGITIDTKEDIIQYGQTGFAPGFVSMNFTSQRQRQASSYWRILLMICMI